MATVSFERLLTALSGKLPLDDKKRLSGPIILLSADVHHSFASRLVYDATVKRFEG